jgi:DNA repair photolyase
MDEGLAIKTNAPEMLEKQLAARAKKQQYGFVAVGSATDAYIHHEQQWKITRQMLEVLLKYRFPVFISTKCPLIERDIDLLKQINAAAILPPDLQQTLRSGVILSVSVSTMNEQISNMIEPGAASPTERMQLVSTLKKQGFITGVNALPLLPFISDTEDELEKIIAAAKEHGADYLLAGSLTLFGNDAADSKTLYYRFLERYDASLIPRYNQLYGDKHYPPFSYQQELKRKADALCKKYSIQNSILK